MPGRHQLIYAYRNFNGGTDLWSSDGWWPEGQWFYVWRTSKPIGIWHTTPFWQWRPMGWRLDRQPQYVGEQAGNSAV